VNDSSDELLIIGISSVSLSVRLVACPVKTLKF